MGQRLRPCTADGRRPDAAHSAARLLALTPPGGGALAVIRAAVAHLEPRESVAAPVAVRKVQVRPARKH